MNILVLPSWYPPYGGVFFEQQSQALAELGNEVTVLSVERVSPRNIGEWLGALLSLWFANYTCVREGELQVIRARVPGLPRAPKLYANIFANKMYRVFKRFQSQNDYNPDVMHVHSLIWAGLGAAKIKASTGTPYLVTEHRGRFVNNQFVDATEKLEMALPELRVALASAQKVLCVSSVLRPYLTNLCPNADIDVLANMVDIPKAVIQKNSSNQATFNFICVGNIVPLKGHKTLVEAFAVLLKQECAIKLTIVGDGWYKQEVEAHVRSLGIDNHVHFTGYVEHSEVTEHLLQADAFVLPSQYEAFGVVYIEAMSLGLPVIATHSGGAVDFVNPSNGLLVHPDDVKGLSEAMYQMMVNIERYDASYISHYVEKHFSKSVIAKRLSGELSAIIGK